MQQIPSPMYHQIILFRVLDCFNLVESNDWKSDQALAQLLKSKAEKMLGWLLAISLKNGDIPHVNDSTSRIAPTCEQLLEYSKRLGLSYSNPQLADSGYRKITMPNYEMIVDVGDIGPDYIPGHAHSDTFNFLLYVDKLPVIVDTGISTYEKNNRRQYERSTKAHNTVQINDLDQSEVWGGFRVAKRAYITDLEEKENHFVIETFIL